ncbi:hypothetical protein ABZ934_03435 [Streptomyces sp. NPDC046557]|uniref:hypothetical protein n=1 Tax=Streptomyces sp. NPDC046557 TaxID=3155372 RepID=UPI00340A1F2D
MVTVGAVTVLAVVAWAALGGGLLRHRHVLVMLLLCRALVKELREDPGVGPAHAHSLHGLRDAVKAMVGDAIGVPGQGHHLRLRRLTEPKGRGRADDDPGEPRP